MKPGLELSLFYISRPGHIRFFFEKTIRELILGGQFYALCRNIFLDGLFKS